MYVLYITWEIHYLIQHFMNLYRQANISRDTSLFLQSEVIPVEHKEYNCVAIDMYCFCFIKWLRIPPGADPGGGAERALPPPPPPPPPPQKKKKKREERKRRERERGEKGKKDEEEKKKRGKKEIGGGAERALPLRLLTPPPPPIKKNKREGRKWKEKT